MQQLAHCQVATCDTIVACKPCWQPHPRSPIYWAAPTQAQNSHHKLGYQAPGNHMLSVGQPPGPDNCRAGQNKRKRQQHVAAPGSRNLNKQPKATAQSLSPHQWRPSLLQVALWASLLQGSPAPHPSRSCSYATAPYCTNDSTFLVLQLH